jgi:hypothetical protein
VQLIRRQTPILTAETVFDLRVEQVYLALRAASDRDAVDVPVRTSGVVDTPDRWLARRLHLSSDALDFLWTAVAFDADPRVAPLAARIGGPSARRGATIAQHAAIFGLDGPRGRALTAELEPHSPLARADLLVAVGDGAPLATTPFLAASRLRAFLRGEDRVDALLAPFGGVLAIPPAPSVAPEHAQAVETLARAIEDGERVLMSIEGPDGAGRREAVARAAATVARAVVELDLARWDGRAIALSALVVAWRRECLLRGAVGLCCAIDTLSDAERRTLALLLDETPGPILVTTRPDAAPLALARPMLRVPFGVPGATARRRAWNAALPDVAGVDIDLLARRYRVGEPVIARAVSTARLIGDGVTTATIVDGLRAAATDRLGNLCTRVPVTQSWDDLVLPDDTMDQIQGLIARVRHAHLVLDRWGFASRLPRGQGLAALLSGPPGTGKTMVAGLIARELDLELMQVDLSRVVSKYIGETEKQLGAIFDAAEAGHGLLLFDEADSLFAKRTEVKGANDRYANLEVNYLLQRVESFGGIVVLTTNFETAIDPAVRRRLGAHIAFWPPDEVQRADLWRRMIPASAPFDGELDVIALARAFPQMSGAHIRNAVVSAAFLAADGGVAPSQRHLERAARAEYQTMGHILGGKK